MQGAEVAILKETSQKALASFLQSHEALRGEAYLAVYATRNLADESLEGKPRYDVLALLLVLPDLSEGEGADLVRTLLDWLVDGGHLATALLAPLASLALGGESWRCHRELHGGLPSSGVASVVGVRGCHRGGKGLAADARGQHEGSALGLLMEGLLREVAVGEGDGRL